MIRYAKFLRSDKPNKSFASDPENWDELDFESLKDDGRHPTFASANAAATNAATLTVPTTVPTTGTVCPDTKKAEKAWLSWQRSRRDVDKYPILTNDREYSDWKVSMTRQFEEDRCSRMIDDNFVPTMVKYGPDDVLLYKAQETHMSIVLARVLQTSDGKRFNRKHMEEPREVWQLHEEH